MVRNRNGYWMSPGFAAMYAPDDGGGSGDPGAAGGDNPGGAAGQDPAGGDGGNGAGDGNNGGDDGNKGNPDIDALNAEIARLKAEMARQKAAMDKATSEASAAKKELRSKMTQEQIDAAEKAEAAEKAAKELEDLRKQVAKGNTVKTVMGKLGLDEEAAGNLADHLYGAADIENALLEIQKAWQAKEKALRLEFGKIPGPGQGGDSNSPEAQAIARAANFGKAQKAVNDQAQKALNAYLR